jgi:serine/threonine-protein kinase RsbW
MRPYQAVEGSNLTSASGAHAEVVEARATCRRQAHVIDALGGAVSVLRGEAAALKAENAELRADNDWMRNAASDRVGGRAVAGEALQVRMPRDVRAPGAARLFVGVCLRDRVPAAVLESALLVVSELVSNSVIHGDASATGIVVVRVALTENLARVEVEDGGRAGVIAPRSPDLQDGGGFGLNVVQKLSERWGLERVAAGGTRVWAQFAAVPQGAGASRASPAGGSRSPRHREPSHGRAPRRRRPHDGGSR